MCTSATFVLTFLLICPTSLDVAIQDEFSDFNGVIFAIDPRNGTIFSEYSDPLVRDAKFPPGSLVKVFTALAALSEGAISEDFLVCCGSSTPETPVRESCWFRPGHGQLDLVQALAHSCDRYFMEVARQTSFEQFIEVLEQFGLTEESKRLDTLSLERRLDTMVGLGTEFRAAPRDILYAFCALYNGGYLFSNPARGARKLEINGDALLPIQRGMRESAVYGTSVLAQQSAGARALASKTGTASHVSDYRKTHGWYVGFYHEQGPQIGVLVFLEEGLGSRDAAAVGGRVFELYFKNHD